MISAPGEWNYRLLEALFHLLPHSAKVDSGFQFVISNPLVSTWIFAACFYWFWSQDDPRRPQRREQLLRVVVALAIAVLLTLLVRPWARWPAPVLNPSFRILYPQYLWGNGSADSFPSHATLVYAIVAIGLWNLNRTISLLLLMVTLLTVSLPRVYLGGHYPGDVLASLALSVLTVTVVDFWPIPSQISDWLSRTAPAVRAREILVILWIFELGEGFKDATAIANAARRLLWR